MDRLTIRSTSADVVWMKDRECLLEPCEISIHQIRLLLEKLAYYEDLKEQEILVKDLKAKLEQAEENLKEINCS